MAVVVVSQISHMFILVAELTHSQLGIDLLKEDTTCLSDRIFLFVELKLN